MVAGDVDDALRPGVGVFAAEGEGVDVGAVLEGVGQVVGDALAALEDPRPVAGAADGELVVGDPLAADEVAEDGDVGWARPPVQGAVDVGQVVVVADEVEALAVAVEGFGDVVEEEVDQGVQGEAEAVDGAVGVVDEGGESEEEVGELERSALAS